MVVPSSTSIHIYITSTAGLFVAICRLEVVLIDGGEYVAFIAQELHRLPGSRGEAVGCHLYLSIYLTTDEWQKINVEIIRLTKCAKYFWRK